MPTRTNVRGKGAIAVAAQATTENKLKVIQSFYLRSTAHQPE